MPPKTNEDLLSEFETSLMAHQAINGGATVKQITNKVRTLLTKKDKQREEAEAEARREELRKIREGITNYVNQRFLEGIILDPYELLETLKPPTKDIKEQMRQPQQYTKEQEAQRQAMIEQAN
jgi:hypothetical protein